MGFFGEHEPDAAVVAYDQVLVPWLFEHWAAPMADLTAPLPSSRIADLACGSGLMVRHLLGRLGDSGSIHGVDFDSGMLRYAATTVDDERVAWHESDAAQLPFETAGIDRVCCHQGLQFFPDPSAALAEIRRVLVPGGRVAVAVWGDIDSNPWPAALAAAVGQLVGDDAGDGMKVVCDLGDPAEVEGLLASAGFERIVVDVHERTATHADVRAAVGGQLSALPSGSAIGALGPEQLAELTDLMCELLADHVDPGGGLTVPSTSTFAYGGQPSDRRESRRVTGMRKILVSGCLNGRPIRFNETSVEVDSAIWDRWMEEGRLVAFCPELAAGFPVPRAPAEIVGSDAAVVLQGRGAVLEDNGTDVTEQFVTGARLAVERAGATGCVAAVLTDGSPSCGTTYVYDGGFAGGTTPGMGVTAQLLADRGLAVFAESQIEEADRFVRSGHAEE